MKKRGKIALSIAVCTICLAFLVVGVYASTGVNLTTTSTLNFTPTDAYTGIEISTYQGSGGDLTKLEGEEYYMAPIYNFTPDTNGFPDGTEVPYNAFFTETGEITSWQVGDIILYSLKPTVRYEVKVYNYSNYDIYFTATNNTGSITGLTVSPSNPFGTQITIPASNGSTPESITFYVDFTVTSNDYLIESPIALQFDIGI